MGSNPIGHPIGRGRPDRLAARMPGFQSGDVSSNLALGTKRAYEVAMSSSGPGCSPLKATTRVHIPTSLPGLDWAGVVQSAERRLGKAEIAGSSPAVSSSWVRFGRGKIVAAVAQQAERPACTWQSGVRVAAAAPDEAR